MWIYSLGITLRRTTFTKNRILNGNHYENATTFNNNNKQNVYGHHQQQQQQHHSHSQHHLNHQQQQSQQQQHYHQHQQQQYQQQHHHGYNKNLMTATNSNLTSLDHVISTMCEKNLSNRASLMFLLDVSI